MRTTLRLITAAATVLSVLPLALAHGDEEGMDLNMDSHMGGGMNMTSPGETDWSKVPMSYFRLPDHAWMLWSHAGLMVLAWFFALPIAVMLSIARSRYQLMAESVFQAIHGVAMLAGTAYNASTPDLYPNNAHHKFGWILNGVVVIHFVLLLLRKFAFEPQHNAPSFHERMSFLPVSTTADDQLELNKPKEYSNRFSGDSGQGSDRASSPIDGPHSAGGYGSPRNLSGAGLEDVEDFVDEPLSTYPGSRIEQFVASKVPKIKSRKITKTIDLSYAVLDRTRIPMGFIAVAMGVVTMGGLFMGQQVFSGLAHFIKGGIFVGYGILTLGRWLGCFAEFGWAWNINPKMHPGVPSAEWTESFVIFLYGITNVFLEHLGGAGGAWSATDLEHLSITFMFAGGGLFGMFVESKRIRRWLHTQVMFNMAEQPSLSDDETREPESYNFSMNPMPSLIIFLLGMMMSMHHQDSMVSTMLHKMWGNLLSGFAFARMLTYIQFFINPPKSVLPGRPPTELVTSFCLMAGGLLFMSSNWSSIETFELYHIDAMFGFNVTVAIVSFFMAWITIVIAIKGLALRAESPNARWARA